MRFLVAALLAAARTDARDPKAARDLLRFMTAPAAAAVLGKAGVEPSVE